MIKTLSKDSLFFVNLFWEKVFSKNEIKNIEKIDLHKISKILKEKMIKYF